jgi:hypothetical protein
MSAMTWAAATRWFVTQGTYPLRIDQVRSVFLRASEKARSDPLHKRADMLTAGSFVEKRCSKESTPRPAASGL